jgi:hypothetical protein
VPGSTGFGKTLAIVILSSFASLRVNFGKDLAVPIFLKVLRARSFAALRMTISVRFSASSQSRRYI